MKLSSKLFLPSPRASNGLLIVGFASIGYGLPGGIGASLAGRLLLLDALAMEWRTARLKRDPACPVCSARGAA